MNILHEAITNNHAECVKKLLELGCSPNKSIDDEENMTPLHLAVDVGSVKITEELLKRGASINALNREKLTPLDICERSGKKRTKLLLLQNGAKFAKEL